MTGICAGLLPSGRGSAVGYRYLKKKELPDCGQLFFVVHGRQPSNRMQCCGDLGNDGHLFLREAHAAEDPVLGGAVHKRFPQGERLRPISGIVRDRGHLGKAEQEAIHLLEKFIQGKEIAKVHLFIDAGEVEDLEKGRIDVIVKDVVFIPGVHDDQRIPVEILGTDAFPLQKRMAFAHRDHIFQRKEGLIAQSLLCQRLCDHLPPGDRDMDDAHQHLSVFYQCDRIGKLGIVELQIERTCDRPGISGQPAIDGGVFDDGDLDSVFRMVRRREGIVFLHHLRHPLQKELSLGGDGDAVGLPAEDRHTKFLLDGTHDPAQLGLGEKKILRRLADRPAAVDLQQVLKIADLHGSAPCVRCNIHNIILILAFSIYFAHTLIQV